MTSDTATPLPSPLLAQRLRVPAGQVQLLWLTAGSELHGLDAPVALQPLDGLGSPPARLGPGQGWRAPGDGWVRLLAQGGPATVRLQPPPATRPQAQKNRPGHGGLGRFGWRWLARWIRPGRLSA